MSAVLAADRLPPPPRTASAPDAAYYWDGQFQRPAVKILPGEYYVSHDDILIVTVLGSCVSACLRDPVAGVGGMNHFMLPDTECDARDIGIARYGSYAMELLINDLLKMGAARKRLEAKVFGGGNVLNAASETHVGVRNAEFVLKYLANEGVPVLAEDLGERQPRKLFFFPLSGRVLVKRLPAMTRDESLMREVDYRARLSAPPAGDIELFN